MEKKEETDEKNKAGNVTVSVTSGDFPLHKWREWDDNCKKDFNDIRWAKMWNDHEAAQREKQIGIGIVAEIQLLHNRISELEQKLDKAPEPKHDAVKTFGKEGNVNE